MRRFSLGRPNFVLLQNKFFQNSRCFFSSSPTPVGMKDLSESWVSGSSANYVEAMYESYLEDPSSVHISWKAYFDNLQAGVVTGERAVLPFNQVGAMTPEAATRSSSDDSQDMTIFKLSQLIRSYQVRGHRRADLDPLGLQQKDKPYIPHLDPSWYGFTEADMEKTIHFPAGCEKFGYGLLGESEGKTIREVVRRLQNCYSKNIGLEYMHIQDLFEKNWIRKQTETAEPFTFPKEEKLVMLDRLLWAESFEKFLAQKWSTAKRFGLEGGEALIPGVKAMIDTAVDLGVTNVVMGMPHRGRLNTLATILRKPLEGIFSEFSGGGVSEEDMSMGSGDVKYHLGTAFTRPTRSSGKEVFLTLLSNPSHLEAVNPCVLGKARAKQDTLGDTLGTQVMPVLFHGDASFAGQGIVYETMNFWELEGYKVGGCVHIVVNNQVGFTTDPKDARSTPYCTAVAKAVDAPIFHVNGDCVEDVVHCFNLAARYRQEFHKDVVIDLVCYRRYGHNEMDQPKFTQPLMYDVIEKHPTTLQIYSEKLLKEGTITKEELQANVERVQNFLEEAYEKSKGYKSSKGDWLASNWKGFNSKAQLSRIRDTGLPRETLKKVGYAISERPANFSIHKNIVHILEKRRAMFEHDQPLDWAAAELLAYGTLLNEGNRVRLSGQDVQRGTFTHRHAILTDQKTNEKYNLLAHIDKDQAPFYCYNSPLSEFGILGFELGYAGEDPNQLVLWEAQFGDFANSAQVMIDQFVASGEAKWLRQAGLTMLLPHGYDGMGPEHSSARLERYLQLVNSDPFVVPENCGSEMSKQVQECNLQVVVPSTPANIFHLLRRQVHRKFRKPLIVMSPKNLLRHPECVSHLSEFDDVEDKTETEPWATDVRVRRVIGETDVGVYQNHKNVKRIVFCSGKIYYELVDERRIRKVNDVALIRVEQLAPFPFDLIQANVAHYPNAEIFWCQEEPMNAGAYSFVAPHFNTALNGITPKYCGRPSAAATATGYGPVHVAEQKKVIKDAFDLPYSSKK